ncbi:unnamed protein product [Spodoptera exigua]|nr:unnamed protein product [Spodoptera exigua]
MVRKCLRYYNNLLDNMLIVDRPLQILLSIEVVCGIPRWIEGMYFISCDLMTGGTTNSVFFNTFEITFNIILVTSPAFVVELIANKTDEIKAILISDVPNIRIRIRIRGYPRKNKNPYPYPYPLFYTRIFYGSFSVNHQSDLEKTVLMLTEVIATVTMMSIPGVVVELVKDEVDRIKTILVMQIIRCSDQSLRSELETALQHIHRRPFNFMLLNAVPIDINMPIGLISLSITYVIIFTQFRHFAN